MGSTVKSMRLEIVRNAQQSVKTVALVLPQRDAIIKLARNKLRINKASILYNAAGETLSGDGALPLSEGECVWCLFLLDCCLHCTIVLSM